MKLENIESRYRQTSRKEGKNLKRVSLRNKATTQNQTISQKSHQRDRRLGYPSCRILGTILEVNEGAT